MASVTAGAVGLAGTAPCRGAPKASRTWAATCVVLSSGAVLSLSAKPRVTQAPGAFVPGLAVGRPEAPAASVRAALAGQRPGRLHAAWQLPRPTARLPRASLEGSASAPKKDDGNILKQVVLFLMYLVSQTGLNVYMKWLVSKVPIAPGLTGLPASFLVTGLQQLTAFGLFMLLLVGSRLLPGVKPYQPKSIRGRDRLLVIVLALAFGLNVGLNNFSLVLIPLSLNLIIRACLPLSTAVSQTLLRGRQDISGAEWLCMVAGVVCAAVTVVSNTHGKLVVGSGLLFGICVAVMSTFSGAVDMVMKSVMGGDLKLSPVDSMCYMSVPALLFLLIPGIFWVHPITGTWAKYLGTTHTTDLAVFMKVLALRPAVFAYAILSGVVAFGYNVFTTFLAVQLSPATTSFAGNFNKAAGILFSLLVLERWLPTDGWGLLTLGSILGNIAAFATYNSVRQARNAKK